MLTATRRTILASAAATALPRFAIAQPDDRPALTIAVQKIANTGTLEPLREQSSNASEHYLAAMLETPVARNQQHWLERVPGLAASTRRIDDRTVELTLRPGVTSPGTSAPTACSAPRCRRTYPRSPAATGRRWTAWKPPGRSLSASSTARRT